MTFTLGRSCFGKDIFSCIVNTFQTSAGDMQLTSISPFILKLIKQFPVLFLWNLSCKATWRNWQSPVNHCHFKR